MADEIVVFGKINEERDRNMHAMQKQFLDTALKLNRQLLCETRDDQIL